MLNLHLFLKSFLFCPRKPVPVEEQDTQLSFRLGYIMVGKADSNENTKNAPPPGGGSLEARAHQQEYFHNFLEEFKNYCLSQEAGRLLEEMSGS